MSYCRTSEADSDIYVFGDLDDLVCFGASDKIEQERPVHLRVEMPDWETVDADGVVVEWPPLPKKLDERSLQIWRKLTPPYKPPTRMQPSGDKTHEGPATYLTTSRSEMINHLEQHRKAGHKVPQDAIDRLRQEIDEVGDEY